MAKRNLSKNLEKPPARIGRPPEEVPEHIADALLTWLYEGKTMKAFCEQEGMPKRRTIDDWKAKDATFAAALARARAASAEALMDMAQDEADDRAEDPQRSKVRIDTLAKRAAGILPSVWGTNRAQVEHSGGVQITVVSGVPEPGVGE